MSLTNVWVQTLSDGLVRADQVIGVTTHPTPAIAGKPSRWLLDVVLPTSTGSGGNDTWVISALHRTLAQTQQPPKQAPADFARLLAQLDADSATGVISTAVEPDGDRPGATTVRFRFAPFTPAGAAEQHRDGRVGVT